MICYRVLSQLRTSLYYHDPRALRADPIRITDDSDTLCYQDGSVLYVNASLLSHTITLSVAVSSGLCRVLSLPLSYAPVLAMLIASPDNMDNVLTQLRLDSSVSSVTSRGVPGVEVDSSDLALLELKPYKKYNVGEIVAYEEGEKYCYGRVVAIEEDSMLGKVAVRTRNGVVHMLLTSVYTFRPAGYLAKRGTTAPPSSKQKQTVVKKITEVSKGPEDTGISHDELMKALHSVLERAGIPLSLEESVVLIS